MTRLQELNKKTIINKMTEQFGYKNKLQTPKLEKVVINIGVGESLTQPGQLEKIINNLAIISGQKPIINKAKQSIAGFKIREGDKVGVSVTLRGRKMYDFIDRLVSITLPRIRDFRGISQNSFDKQGNYTLGIKEHTVFPEIPYDTVEFTHGLQISITTSAKTKEEGKALLTYFGFPFGKEK
ncbi:MAG: 50S ribosomal protein L5 [bacterium]|nr:50S ribosomal protein L5 [bacterium]